MSPQAQNARATVLPSHCNKLVRRAYATLVTIAAEHIGMIDGSAPKTIRDDHADDESRDYTAEQLAKLCNVSLSVAQWWKRGRRLPHIARIRLTAPPSTRQSQNTTPRSDDGELLYGKSAEQIADVLGVSLATAQRWKRTRKLPHMARRAIRALLAGDLGSIDPAWKGWSVRNGMLCGPDTYTFRPGEVLAIPFVREQLKSYSAKATAAKDALTWKTQADWIENAYVAPGETLTDPESDAELRAAQALLREDERIERLRAERLAGLKRRTRRD